MRRSVPVFTLNREGVPLAFQADHAGSIPVTRSTENRCTTRVFARPQPAASWLSQDGAGLGRFASGGQIPRNRTGVRGL